MPDKQYRLCIEIECLTQNMHKLYQTIKEEHEKPVEGKITGDIPDWICGSLYRNGPGMYEVGENKYQHLFDPLAMFTRFHIENKKVTYQNRFLQSDTYKINVAAQRIDVDAFGTLSTPDPCQNIFQRFLSYFTLDKRNDNTNVNIFPLKDDLYAATETNFINRIDPDTLDTLEKVDLKDYVAVNTATAHPHYDADGTVHNLGSSFKGGPKICIIKFPPKKEKADGFPQGQMISAIRSSGITSINYLHSFGLTENHYVYVEQPMFINVLNILTAKIRGSPMAASLDFYASIQARFRIINKKTGEEVNPEIRYEADPFMVFHHINAYEDNGHVVVDLCALSSSEALNYVYLKDLTSEKCEENWRKYEEPEPRRYVLPLNITQQTPKNKNLVEITHAAAKAEMKSDDTVYCTWETLANTGMEFPQINYQRFNGKKYRYVYGVGWHTKEKHFNTVMKIDINTKTYKEWGEDDCYPSEPVFVSNPKGTEEDDGVILSSVNNSNFDKGKNAFLLVLDAKTMKEIARAEFEVPRFPKDFHGLFRSNP